MEVQTKRKRGRPQLLYPRQYIGARIDIALLAKAREIGARMGVKGNTGLMNTALQLLVSKSYELFDENVK